MHHVVGYCVSPEVFGDRTRSFIRSSVVVQLVKVSLMPVYHTLHITQGYHMSHFIQIIQDMSTTIVTQSMIKLRQFEIT